MGDQEYWPSLAAHTIRSLRPYSTLARTKRKQLDMLKTFDIPEYLPSIRAHTVTHLVAVECATPKRSCTTDARLDGKEASARNSTLTNGLRTRERVRQAGIHRLMASWQRTHQLEAAKECARRAELEAVTERWVIPVSIRLEHCTHLPLAANGSYVGPALRSMSFTGRLDTRRTFSSVCAELRSAYAKEFMSLHQTHRVCQVQVELMVSHMVVCEENWIPFLAHQDLAVHPGSPRLATPVTARFACDGGGRKGGRK